MTPETIIKDALSDGVKVAFKENGKIGVSGKNALIKKWLPVIRENKPALVTFLKSCSESVGDLLKQYAPIDDRTKCAHCLNLHYFGGYPQCANRNRKIAAWFDPDMIDTPIRCSGFVLDKSKSAKHKPMTAQQIDYEAKRQAQQVINEARRVQFVELDQAYTAHHLTCSRCIAAGKGYGTRCDEGARLWKLYDEGAL